MVPFAGVFSCALDDRLLAGYPPTAAPFHSADAAGLYVGQTGTLTIEGTMETVTGTIESISGADEVGAGGALIRQVKFRVSNPGGLTGTTAATAVVGSVACAGSGTFSQSTGQTVVAQTAGEITALHVTSGSPVSYGTVLATIGGTAAETTLENARIGVENAKLALDSRLQALENYEITAPISGTVIEKNFKAGDNVDSSAVTSAGGNLAVLYDMSTLTFEMKVNELDINNIQVGQEVEITADALEGMTFKGYVDKININGTTANGRTTYPVTVRIDETDGLRPGMNANAEIVVAQAKNALAVPNAAVVRGSYVLVTQDSPSAVNADPDMVAPDGFVYVKVKLGVSDSDYTQVVSGLTAQDTVGYDPSSVSSDTYYDNGGYEYMTDGTTDTTGGETTDGTADGEGAESTVTEEPAVDEPVDAGNDGEVIGEADGVILT